MCGIAGVVARRGPVPHEAELRRMADTLVHRGPDEEGLGVQGPVGLSMRRLSIIDVAGAHQPLVNEDGSVRVVFNGEIYNYRELRRELEARGHRFRSEGDGEVLPHLWEDHGEDFLRRLDGMFALALHDARRGVVLLARDHAGIKPLYYALNDDALVFGSEVKAILASGRVPVSLDPDALREFIAWEYVPAPGTLHREIRKLRPGELLHYEIERGTASPRTWWRLEEPEGGSPASFDEGVERVDAVLRSAVRRQMVSDVPLGAFLSGGVDSSLVVAAMGPATRTFSIGFDEPSYNELAWSQAVAEHLGTLHRTEVIRPDALELFDHLLTFLDDPIGDFSIFPTSLVARLAREEVTVALSGDGGDELFGGYETYVAQRLGTQWEKLPRFVRATLIERPLRALGPRPEKKGLVNKARRFAQGMDLDRRLGHARWRRFLSRALERELFSAEFREAFTDHPDRHVLELGREVAGDDAIRRALWVDFKSYLTDNCLVKTDRMSMANSLEVRVPFLAPSVVETAFSLPSTWKVSGRRTKPLLKEVAARHVPRSCVYRAKEGFSAPLKAWLRGPFRSRLEAALAPDRLRRDGVFDVTTTSRLVREHLHGTENHSHVLWAMLVFQEWSDRWMG